MVIDIDWIEVSTGCSLPDVSREWALGLVGHDISARMGEIEVVIALGVLSENGIIKHRSKVDGGTL
jgi:hypothetical protein